jgi:hypothetical protein
MPGSLLGRFQARETLAKPIRSGEPDLFAGLILATGCGARPFPQVFFEYVEGLIFVFNLDASGDGRRIPYDDRRSHRQRENFAFIFLMQFDGMQRFVETKYFDRHFDPPQCG